MGQDPVDTARQATGAAHGDGDGEGHQRDGQDQRRPGGPVEQDAQRQGDQQHHQGDSGRPAEPLHALALEPGGPGITPLGDPGADGRGHHRLDGHRPEGQGGPLGPQGQAQGDADDVASGHNQPAEPAAPIRYPEQDVHGGDGQQGQGDGLGETGQGHQARRNRPTVGVRVDQGGRHRDHAAQRGGQEHDQGLALVRSPDQGDQAGDGEGHHHGGPDDLGGEVAVRVDRGRAGRAGDRHQGQSERDGGGERFGLGRAGQAPVLGAPPGALPDLAELADDYRCAHVGVAATAASAAEAPPPTSSFSMRPSRMCTMRVAGAATDSS